jgi:hypothetical protein
MALAPGRPGWLVESHHEELGPHPATTQMNVARQA